MPVLLDTNVLISAILLSRPPRRLLEKGLRGKLEFVTGPALMAELEEVLPEKFDFPSVTASGVRQETELTGPENRDALVAWLGVVPA